MQALRHWTVHEANAVLPAVAARLERLQTACATLRSEAGAEGLARAAAEPGGGWPGREAAEAALTLTRGAREFERAGIVVRDLDRGLLDFPSMRDGEEVYLCWLQGEEAVTHWHHVDAGFPGRRPV